MIVRLLILPLLFQATLPASEDPRPAELPILMTEGPDFTDSARLVGTGVLQMENVVTFSREQKDSSFSGPETLVRYGISRRLELRLGSAGLQSDRVGKTRLIGWTDVEAAVKIRVWEQTRFRPALSLIPILAMPAGGSNYSGGYNPTLKAAWSKDLPQGFSLDGNFNAASMWSPAGRFRQTAVSVSLGHDLKGGIGASVELFGLSSEEKNGPAAWVANAGISRGVGRHIQLEANAGRRITSAGPDWFCAAGTTFRHPRFLSLH